MLRGPRFSPGVFISTIVPAASQALLAEELGRPDEQFAAFGLGLQCDLFTEGASTRLLLRRASPHAGGEQAHAKDSFLVQVGHGRFVEAVQDPLNDERVDLNVI